MMAQKVFCYVLLIDFSKLDPVLIVLGHSVSLVAACSWSFIWEQRGREQWRSGGERSRLQPIVVHAG